MGQEIIEGKGEKIPQQKSRELGQTTKKAVLGKDRELI